MPDQRRPRPLADETRQDAALLLNQTTMGQSVAMVVAGPG